MQLHVVRPLIASTDGQSAVTFPSDDRSTSLSSKSFRSIAVLPSASLSCTATSTVSRPLTPTVEYTEAVRSTERSWVASAAPTLYGAFVSDSAATDTSMSPCTLGRKAGKVKTDLSGASSMWLTSAGAAPLGEASTEG